MRILFLAPANSIHTTKWVNSLEQKGHDVFVISMQEKNSLMNPKITYYRLFFTAPLGYLLNIFNVRKFVKKIKPDVIQVHYVTGYGFLSMVSRLKNPILIPWGSDLNIFPKISIFHKLLIKKILSSGHFFIANGKNLDGLIRQYSRGKRIEKIYFGIDTDLFKNISSEKKHVITIGTVKSLENIYGIDILIKSFAVVNQKIISSCQDIPLRLVIVGSGSQKGVYEKLVTSLNLETCVEFMGSIDNNKVPNILRTFDIFVAASRSESFGVAVLEASSCGLPVVVSNVGGLTEVVENAKTGLVCESENIKEFSEAIYKLVINKELRVEYGENGRKRVLKYFNWNQSVSQMVNLLQKFHLEK